MATPCALETADGPPAYLGGLRPRRDLIGRLRDATGRAVVRGFKRAVAWGHRRMLRELGLPAVYRADGSEAAYSPERILALGLRELEFAQDWPDAVRFVGPVRYTPPGGGETPPFVDGRPHVLVSLGTHLRRHKDRAADAIRVAAEALPQVEFHFTDGRVDEKAHAREAPRGPANFHRLPFIHYGFVPRYDLVVHHAGIGIVYETLAAGLPAIVLPFDYDQFDYAARLTVAGLAARVRALDELPRAIEQALSPAPLASSYERRMHYREVLRKESAETHVAALVRERVRHL